MLENKRKFERFNLSVITQFRLAGKITRKALGLTKNFSRDGISIETRDFTFTPDDNLAIELRSPVDKTSVSLLGTIVWKKQVQKSKVAGIKLIYDDENIQDEKFAEICSFGNIPAGSVPESAKNLGETNKQSKEKPEAVISTEESKILSASKSEPGFVKEYLKSGKCKVTFRLPEEAVRDAREVTIVGDFNDWDTTAASMDRIKDGSFQITLNLSTEREYKFRYCIDGMHWENDWCADRYEPNSYGSDDSVVIV